MKKIWIYPISKAVDVSVRTHDLLRVYKIFFPPETAVQLTKSRAVKLKDISPWLPDEEVAPGVKGVDI